MWYLKDDRRRSRLRADFRQYYTADLYSFFEEEEPDLEQLSCWLEELPNNSRTMTDGGFNQEEHLLADIVDLLIDIRYQNQWLLAAKKISPSKIKKNAPEGITRPLTDYEKANPKKPKIMSGAELMGKMNNQQRTDKTLNRKKMMGG